MSESQVEKLLKTLSKKDAEIERLRELMQNLVENAKGGDEDEIIVDVDDFDAIEKEVGDE